MRTVLHLSDLHFGALDEALVAPLIDAIARARPDLVVVSGDLTQRARKHEFIAARAFLDALPAPKVVVPGNHDVPLYDLAARFLTPLSAFRRYIAADVEPLHEDGELIVLGLNSARSSTLQDGRLNRHQEARLTRVFEPDSAALKLLVCHHPFDLPPGSGKRRIVGAAGRILAAMAGCRADAVLTGHLHTSHSTSSAAVPIQSGHWTLALIQAGTATSTRRRGESASFNAIRVDGPRMEVERFHWQPAEDRFAASGRTRFERGPAGWARHGE